MKSHGKKEWSLSAAPSHRSAFTLIELLMVVAVMVLISGVAGGLYLGTYQNRVIEQAGRQMLLTAGYARLFAIENQRSCKMQFDRNQRKYWLSYDEYDEESPDPVAKVIQNQYSRPVSLPEAIQLEKISIVPMNRQEMDFTQDANGDAIHFYANGTADSAGVSIGNTKTHYTLKVAAATGKAKLEFGLLEERTSDMVDLDQP
jgi:prepilin-type N-terminal cleavage/methylation domain-containing protein